MGALVNYDLFNPNYFDADEVKEKLNEVFESCDKVRKKLFAENSALKKKCIDLESRLDILEKSICNYK